MFSWYFFFVFIKWENMNLSPGMIGILLIGTILIYCLYFEERTKYHTIYLFVFILYHSSLNEGSIICWTYAHEIKLKSENEIKSCIPFFRIVTGIILWFVIVSYASTKYSSSIDNDDSSKSEQITTTTNKNGICLNVKYRHCGAINAGRDKLWIFVWILYNDIIILKTWAIRNKNTTQMMKPAARTMGTVDNSVSSSSSSSSSSCLLVAQS